MITGRRVSMVFAGPSQSRFDRGHYLQRHLPVALASALRVTPISYCDLDLPLEAPPVGESCVHAICVLHFGHEEGMTEFRRAMADRPGAAGTLADRSGFTALEPLVFGADSLLLGDGRRTAFRVRVLLPPASLEAAEEAMQRLVGEVDALRGALEIRRRELDVARCGLATGSSPPSGGLATFYLDEGAQACELAAALRRGMAEQAALQCPGLEGAVVAASRVSVLQLDRPTLRGVDA